jgi:hypothetical protein
MSELINPPDKSAPPEIANWPDSSGIAEITWASGAAGRTFG